MTTQTRTAWPERYYEEFDPETRRQLLEEALAAGEGDTAENELRRLLWERRYTRPRRNAPPADRYIARWRTRDHWRKAGPHRARAAARELGRLAPLLRPEGGGDAQALLHRELVHAVRLYLSTCARGSYGTLLMGLVRMNSDQLLEKVAREVAEVTILVPRWAGLEAEFAPLAPAAREAFELAFPEGGAALEDAFARCGQAEG